MDDESGFNALTDTYENLVEGRRHRPGQGRALGAAERRRRSPRCCSRPKRSICDIPEEKKERAAAGGPAAAWAGCTEAHGRADARLRGFQGLSALRCRSPFLSPSVTIGQEAWQ